MDSKTIFLYGPPASGKTTLGARLAAALAWRFIDLDGEIERRSGRAIPEIFAREGEATFRELERQTLAAVAESRKEDRGGLIVALGGGTLLNPECKAVAEACGKIWLLEAPDDAELERRIASRPGSRPLGNRAKERAAHYASFPARVTASFDLVDSLVVVGTGLEGFEAGAKAAVADENLAGIYSDFLAGLPLFAIPAGECNKRLETVMGIWRHFAASGIGRSDAILAFGGGITGDLCGFAAATWMRGVPWINAPTSLLAMVDASTGGKTGCDLDEGKNLIGAFHSPRLVVIDAARLSSLPERELACGQAEMIKHEIISGRCRTSIAKIPDAKEIASNLSVKVGIVRQDPFETKGLRALLNCGHTIGHALETASGYSLSHGEAVAIGCVEEAKLAVRLGFAHDNFPKALAERFAAAGLPTSLGGFTLDSLAPLMLSDKKKVGGKVAFALPCAFGDVRSVLLDPMELP